MPEYQKLTADLPEAERARWCVVHLGTGQTLPGIIIISADESTGLCIMRVSADEDIRKEYSLGVGGLRIVRR